MKQVKNFDALKKCGFVEMYVNYEKVYNYYSYRNNVILQVKTNGELEEIRDYDYIKPEELDCVFDVVIEMTNAGCFDEPVKTLSDLGIFYDRRVEDDTLSCSSCQIAMTCKRNREDKDCRELWIDNLKEYPYKIESGENDTDIMDAINVGRSIWGTKQ